MDTLLSKACSGLFVSLYRKPALLLSCTLTSLCNFLKNLAVGINISQRAMPEAGMLQAGLPRFGECAISTKEEAQ